MTDALSLAEATAAMTAPGQMFEIETLVLDGVEMSVWKHATRNLAQILELSRRHEDAEFLVYENQRVTFNDHYRIVATLATRLQSLGITKGDRVAIAARNLPQWVEAFWATMVLGAISVPINAWWTTDELAYGLADSGARVAFVDEERLERLLPVLDDLPDLVALVVMSLDPSNREPLSTHGRVSVVRFEEFLGGVDPEALAPSVDVEPDDVATIFYTSGTTGRPKGAIGTHRNIITNLMNLFFIGQRATLRFGAGDERGQNATLLNIPLFHATGCLASMVVSTAAGGKLVMMHHFEPGAALSLIETERMTMVGGVPTIVMQLLDHPDFSRFDTSSVRNISYGGAPAPPDLVRRIREAFPQAQPGNGYGLTETSAAIALNSGPDYVARPDSCGPAVPVCDVAIVPEDFVGDEPDPAFIGRVGERGELWVKGPNVSSGYWGKPDESRRAFTRGWLHTGDIARLDEEGFIYILDRAKDMIIRGGENVYSVIVEAALYEHPDVVECAVIGVAHPTLGEEVAAVVVLRPGRRVDAEDLSRHVAQRLAKFEVPTRYFFRSAPLPRNPQGKVLKRELRDSVL
ncbi:MAG TPA: class I adenylate-forming enzyme family protein [Acidimicrobiales bacterium]|nr:class I adenylate-forming enzyme family protein [Acidimicrobiales bacterium]